MIREFIDRYHQEVIYPQLVQGPAQIDREIAHELALDMMEEGPEKHPALLALMNRFFTYDDPTLRKRVFGVDFRNPLGMAPGFDKNGRVVLTLGAQGFGFVEVGTMTKIKYGGNSRVSEGEPTPRIFQLEEDDGLINRLGFPGDGVDENVARMAAKLPPKNRRVFRVAGNIGASRPSFDQGKAVEHYIDAFKAVPAFLVDFKVVNVSSPNTEGVTKLQSPEVIDEMLTGIDEYHTAHPEEEVPYLAKFGPDLTMEEYDALMDVLLSHKTSGVVLTNTTANPQYRDSLLSPYQSLCKCLLLDLVI